MSERGGSPCVVHLGKYYPPAAGGIESHTATLARQQAKLGWTVRVVVVNHAVGGRDSTWSPFRPTPTVWHERDGAVQLTRLGRWASIARLDLCPTLLHELDRLRRRPPDILHLHTPNPLMMAALALVPVPAPLVVTHHSDVIRQRIARRLLHPWEQRIYRRAKAIITTSALYAAGSSSLQPHRSRVIPVPLGCDLQPYLQPSPDALAQADRWRRECPGPVWLTVGRLIYYKGLSVAVEALREVPGTLVIVGTGPLTGDLRRQAETLGLSERVRFVGHLSEVELIGAYRAATAFWFPSNARSEGFGLVQVEAMASGCPVINTHIPDSGVSWVSPHGISGLTVPMNDPAAFAAAARRLLDEPGLRGRLAAAARERAIAEFRDDQMARRTLAVYEAVRG